MKRLGLCINAYAKKYGIANARTGSRLFATIGREREFDGCYIIMLAGKDLGYDADRTPGL